MTQSPSPAIPTQITGITVEDVRFPTTYLQGCDSMNSPDFSCPYVTITTDSPLCGYGFTFTTGRGTDIVCDTVRAYSYLLVGRKVSDLYADLAGFFRTLTREPQLRWLGPEKGVTHIALAAIMNALWDLWARIENKPLWRLLVDMPPEKLVTAIDFSYISDALTKAEALEILKAGQVDKQKRIDELEANGYPAYTTSVAWLGYSDEKVKRLCRESLDEGFTRFKVKVGVSLEDDKKRLKLVRDTIGPECWLMVDANQCWEVNETIAWMKQLTEFNLTWIEEPTSCDDILGHKAIADALNPLGIGVATGEACHNRVMFKQFITTGALQYAQIDSCRLASPTEILAVYLMAHKYKVPICPHAGGVGLCELVQHLSLWDYVCVAQTMDNRVIEFVDHLHEHFIDPVLLKKGHYTTPKIAGYSSEMKRESIEQYKYPQGIEWQKLFASGERMQE